MYRQTITRLLVIMLLSSVAKAQVGQIPDGFKPIFNGKNLKGWHISRTTHQGTTPNFFVEDGAIVGKEKPYGQGGLLLTDKRYKSFEFYAEVKLDSFCNSGSIFTLQRRRFCLPD